MPPRKQSGQTKCSLQVKVASAAGLAAKQSDKEHSCPYALVRVGTMERRTKTILKTLNPHWNEDFSFDGVSEQSLLRVALYDNDVMTEDHFLGECIVPVCALTDADKTETWRALEVRPGSTEYVCGKLCLGITKRNVEPSKTEIRALDSAFVIDPVDINFSDGKMLGQGGFGTVRLGHFRGLPVAVKTLILREGVRKQMLMSEFKDEVTMLAKVSHHPKLCLFIGASVVEPLTVVSELMNGSVRNILDLPRAESQKQLSWQRRVEILLDAGLGMAFLHGMDVVHRDMKADSLLLDEHGSTKVADFGLSKTLGHNAHEHCDVGTPGFKAPEIYDESPKAEGYSLPVDVFAFGSTIYELLTFEGKNWGCALQLVSIVSRSCHEHTPRLPSRDVTMPRGSLTCAHCVWAQGHTAGHWTSPLMSKSRLLCDQASRQRRLAALHSRLTAQQSYELCMQIAFLSALTNGRALSP